MRLAYKKATFAVDIFMLVLIAYLVWSCLSDWHFHMLLACHYWELGYSCIMRAEIVYPYTGVEFILLLATLPRLLPYPAGSAVSRSAICYLLQIYACYDSGPKNGAE